MFPEVLFTTIIDQHHLNSILIMQPRHFALSVRTEDGFQPVSTQNRNVSIPAPSMIVLEDIGDRMLGPSLHYGAQFVLSDKPQPLLAGSLLNAKIIIRNIIQNTYNVDGKIYYLYFGQY